IDVPYPGNFYVSSFADIAFVDTALNDFRLNATSPYKNAGTDGTDLGVDMDALKTASTSVSTPAPGAPSPTTPVPGPAITATWNSGSITATWSGIPSPTPSDWIGLYAPGAPDGSARAWLYVSC